jgi:hypothetical protein
MLQALLYHDFDEYANVNMGYYFFDLNLDLLQDCIDYGNELFLIRALKLEAFNKTFFKDQLFVDKITSHLIQGTRTLYILNVLNLIDMSYW